MSNLIDTMVYLIQQCFVMYSVLVTGKIKPNKIPVARNQDYVLNNHLIGI